MVSDILFARAQKVQIKDWQSMLRKSGLLAQIVLCSLSLIPSVHSSTALIDMHMTFLHYHDGGLRVE